MTTVAELAAHLRPLLTTLADEAARATGFTLRASKLTGSAFVQTQVFGFLSDPSGRLSVPAEMAVRAGVPVTPQSLDERFTDRAAACLRRVLETALERFVSGADTSAPLIRRFEAVSVLDSTTVRLPEALTPLWPGWGAGRGAGRARR